MEKSDFTILMWAVIGYFLGYISRWIEYKMRKP